MTLLPWVYDFADALVAAGVMTHYQRTLFVGALERRWNDIETERRAVQEQMRAERAALPWWRRMWRREV
jgi:hypothetical protein